MINYHIPFLLVGFCNHIPKEDSNITKAVKTIKTGSPTYFHSGHKDVKYRYDNYLIKSKYLEIVGILSIAPGFLVSVLLTFELSNEVQNL